MTSEAVIDLLVTTFVAVLGALFWIRLGRLEAGQDDLKRDLAGVREQMATRSDLDRLREEMAVMRSDLTHVALVVGADRPKPMEGVNTSGHLMYRTSNRILA
jgi:hypothetical protein